jgi:hypothetical protein
LTNSDDLKNNSKNELPEIPPLQNVSKAKLRRWAENLAKYCNEVNLLNLTIN